MWLTEATFPIAAGPGSWGPEQRGWRLRPGRQSCLRPHQCLYRSSASLRPSSSSMSSWNFLVRKKTQRPRPSGGNSWWRGGGGGMWIFLINTSHAPCSAFSIFPWPVRSATQPLHPHPRSWSLPSSLHTSFQFLEQHLALLDSRAFAQAPPSARHVLFFFHCLYFLILQISALMQLP